MFLRIVLPNILGNGQVILAFLFPPLAPKHRKIVNSRRNPQQVRPNCCIWRSQHFFIAKNIQYLNRPQILLNHNMTNKCLQPIGIVVSPPISYSVTCFACEWYVLTMYPKERGTPTALNGGSLGKSQYWKIAKIVFSSLGILLFTYWGAAFFSSYPNNFL